MQDNNELTPLAASVKTARETLEAIIDRVCGACGNKCCHQGTMMGSHDLRRLQKGLLIEEGREQILRDGLRRRSAEVRRDLQAIESVVQWLQQTLPADREPELHLLQERLEQWQNFCDFLDSDFEITSENLRYLICFSAIRHNALRLLREFPDAQSKLIAVAQQQGASFRGTGRRIAAPRCLFDMNGCLAGPWKPAKCANFFCAGEPNVLREIAREMSFDEFVLGNFQVATEQELFTAIALEPQLGPDYVAPKIAVGSSDNLIKRVTELLDSAYELVEVKREKSGFMLSTAEAHTLLQALPDNMAYVIVAESIGSGALYELGVALDRLRAVGTALPFYLFAAEFSQPAALSHPLWADEVMSQPLGAIDLYVVQ